MLPLFALSLFVLVFVAEPLADIAVQHGFNPDIWFNNVECITAVRISQEPVHCVRNIHKYYVACTPLDQSNQAVEAAHAAKP